MIWTWRAHGLRGAGLREGAYAEGRASRSSPDPCRLGGDPIRELVQILLAVA